MLDGAARLEAVRAVQAAVVPDPSGLERLTDLARRLLDVPFAFLSLLDRDVELLVAVQAPGRVPATLPRDRSVCQHLVASGAPLLVPDLREHPALRDLSEVQALGLRAYAGAPVRSRDDQVLGGLCVGDDRPRPWTPAEADLLDRLAQVVADELAGRVALQELARARDDERSRAQEQAALHRIAAMVARGDAVSEVLQESAEELVGLLDARAVAVLRFRRDGGTSVLAAAGPSRPSLDTATWAVHLLARVRSRTGSSGSVVLHEQPCAAVPVTVGGRVWGAVVVLLGQDGSRGQVAHLEQLADFMALVLTNAEAQAQLTRLARTDPLTGAANRRVLEERLTDELRRCARGGPPLVLALLDVDRFKQVNDVHGHAVGDDVLAALAVRVGEALREVDLLARLGGDEWGLLLPGAGAAAADALERVREAVVGAPLAGLPVTVSLGGVVVDGGDVERALRRADEALYEAKRQGRDRVVVRPLVPA